MKHISSIVIVVLAIIIVGAVSVFLFQKNYKAQLVQAPNDQTNTNIAGSDNRAAVLTVGIGSKQGVENYLTDQKGLALYYYANDTEGKSNCGGTCAAAWPVFYTANLNPAPGLNVSDFDIITRADGSEQTTYKGRPLYYYSGDSNPGDIIGNGFDGLWQLAFLTGFKASTIKPAAAPAAVRQAPLYPQVQPNIPGMGLTGITGSGNHSVNYQPPAIGENLGNTRVTGGGYNY